MFPQDAPKRQNTRPIPNSVLQSLFSGAVLALPLAAEAEQPD